MKCQRNVERAVAKDTGSSSATAAPPRTTLAKTSHRRTEPAQPDQPRPRRLGRRMGAGHLTGPRGRQARQAGAGLRPHWPGRVPTAIGLASVVLVNLTA